MTFEEWHGIGYAEGWCSDIVCATHDGLPSTEEEDEAWEQGWDPCVPALRLYDGLKRRTDAP